MKAAKEETVKVELTTSERDGIISAIDLTISQMTQGVLQLDEKQKEEAKMVIKNYYALQDKLKK